MFGIGTLIGAAAGGLGSLFGGSKTSSTTMPDAQTQAIRDAIFQQANGLKSSPAYQGILGGYGGYSDLSNKGAAALGGDESALSSFMNPYIHNVLDQSNAQFDILGRKAQNLVNDQATQAGAFGGSRAAVASGVAAGQVANQQALTNSQLLAGGFGDAQQRAAQAAQLGLQGNSAYLGALGFPTSIYAQALPGGGSTTTQSQGGGGLGGFISGALGGGILGSQYNKAPAPGGNVFGPASNYSFGIGF